MARRAFTAVEVLLTIGVIAVTAGVSIPLYRNYQVRSDLDLATEQAIQALRRAQLLSQSGQHDSAWGYHVTTGTIFMGDGYAIRDDTADEIYPFPSTINTSGLTEVVFGRVDGMPNVSGNIILESLNGERRVIVVGIDGTLSSSGLQSPGEGGDFGEDGFDGDEGGDGEDGSVGEDGENGEDGEDGTVGETGGASSGQSSAGTTSSAGAGGSSTSTGGADSSSSLPPEACVDRFSVAEDGTIETTGTVDVNFKVLGSAITYGAGGPEVQVTVGASTDGGNAWSALFNDQDVDGNEQQAIENLPTGTKIALKFNGRHSWYFNRTYTSNDRSGHVLVLRNGQKPPAYSAFGNQAGLTTFLKSILDSQGKIKIGQYDAVMLVELGDLSTASSDFQDAVVLVQFTQKTGSCGAKTDPRFKINFERLENIDEGDAAKKSYVGASKILYSDGQWIPLKVNGTAVTDSSLVENVQGFAVQRGNGFVRILLHGTLPGGSKEIVDGTVSFEGAQILRIENDTGDNAAENPFDGIVNDGSGGDEVTTAADNRSALYRTRVTSEDDSILIYWQTAAFSSSSVASQASSASSASTVSTGSSTSTVSSGGVGSSQSSVETPDSCAIAYSVTADNKIVLQEQADLTFRVAGSYVTYGSRGPEVQVRVSASTNGGRTWRSLYGYRDVDGGETETISDVPAGSEVLVRLEGRYSWLYRQLMQTNDGSGRMKIFRNGALLPATSPLANSALLKGFMRTLVDKGAARVGRREALILSEFQDLTDTADWQDAPIVLILEKPASKGLCGAQRSESSSSSRSSSAGSVGSQTSSAGTSSTPSSSSAPETQVTICHFPPGNPNNPSTLTVGSSALAAHEAHGDRLGTCTSDTDGDSVQNKDDLCTNTYMPESVPKLSMLFDRYALTQKSTVFRKGPRKQVSEYTLQDTRGCSCEQLIDTAEGKKSYYFEQYPRLYREMRSLFPFYTEGARANGCGIAIMRMVQGQLK